MKARLIRRPLCPYTAGFGVVYAYEGSVQDFLSSSYLLPAGNSGGWAERLLPAPVRPEQEPQEKGKGPWDEDSKPAQSHPPGGVPARGQGSPEKGA